MVKVVQHCECPQCHRSVHLSMTKMVSSDVCMFYYNKKMPKNDYKQL